MRRRRSIVIVAVAISLTLASLACNRKTEAPTSEQRSEQPLSSSATPPPASPTPSTQSPDRPVIVTFGDSLTAGVAGPTYPDDLQDLLDQHGFRYRIDNQGVSGDTTTDGLARLENVVTEHPALVILEFGGNDGLRGVPVDSIRANLVKMIETLHNASLPTALLGITLPPNYGADYVKDFTSLYPSLAKQYRLRFIPFLLVNVYQHPEWMQPDGIHPNGEGNKVLARDVFALIQPLLRRSGGDGTHG